MSGKRKYRDALDGQHLGIEGVERQPIQQRFASDLLVKVIWRQENGRISTAC